MGKGVGHITIVGARRWADWPIKGGIGLVVSLRFG